MTNQPLFILAVLAINVAVSEWLAQRTILRHLGSALLVIVLTAVTANVGWIPTVGEGSRIYDIIFEYLAPMAIFWLLLQVNLRSIRRAGLPMILLFLLGSVGTVVGVLIGLQVVGGHDAFGDLTFALGGMFVGTYTGGSINFNAIALEYGVVNDGLLYAGANVVDSGMTTIWMAATVFIPRILSSRWGDRSDIAAAEVPIDAMVDDGDDSETVHALDLSVLLALGAGAIWISNGSSAALANAWGFSIPSILILTTLALALAQFDVVRRLRGSRVMGWLAVMIFLAVIGALCDVAALVRMEELGVRLTFFVVVVVGIHGLIVFGGGALLRMDPMIAAVASQANIGGSTSALALARSLGRPDLVLPAILIGSLGNGLGTYLGFLVALWLR